MPLVRARLTAARARGNSRPLRRRAGATGTHVFLAAPCLCSGGQLTSLCAWSPLGWYDTAACDQAHAVKKRNSNTASVISHIRYCSGTGICQLHADDCPSFTVTFTYANSQPSTPSCNTPRCHCASQAFSVFCVDFQTLHQRQMGPETRCKRQLNSCSCSLNLSKEPVASPSPLVPRPPPLILCPPSLVPRRSTPPPRTQRMRVWLLTSRLALAAVPA